MKKKIMIVSVIVVIMILVSVISFNLGSKIDTKYTYAVFSSAPENANEDLNATKLIFTFNPKGTCIDCRIMYDFANKETADKQYKAWKEIEADKNNASMTNVDRISNIVTFNTVQYIGKSKTEIMEMKLVGENGNYIQM